MNGGWIRWFCNLEDHHFFCEVETAFMVDVFNLYGLK
jgi:casein kinase II subunit beta